MKSTVGGLTFPSTKPTYRLVSCGGYKGKTSQDGVVETGYEICVDYRNQGLATELAAALVRHAFTFEQVRLVQAHTLGQMNASTSVLVKCGFQKTDEFQDEEDGLIWKWLLRKP